MRFVLLPVAAVVISILLFEMMYRLIQTGDARVQKQPLAQRVNIQAVEDQPETFQASVAKARTEPDISEMVQPIAETIAMPNSVLSDSLILDNLNVDDSDLDLQANFADKQLDRQQNLWIQPGATAQEGSGAQPADYIGERDSGTKEMVPIATRQPLIPKIAWDNKIDGWVLVAFAVDNDGKVKDVRIMDASPRGIFEAHAVSAVRQWRYEAYKGPVKYLSQRIEFLHNNYLNNWGEL